MQKHFIDSDDLKALLEPEGFEDIKVFDDVLPEINMWNGENVLFLVNLLISVSCARIVSFTENQNGRNEWSRNIS